MRMVKELNFVGGEVRHIEEGLMHLIQRAEPPSNNADAQCVLGIIYEEGVLGKRDSERGVVSKIVLFSSSFICFRLRSFKLVYTIISILRLTY